MRTFKTYGRVVKSLYTMNETPHLRPVYLAGPGGYGDNF